MTVYAQVKDDQILKFPYTLGDLIEENPFTRFDQNVDLVATFLSTELAIKDNLHLVEVEYLPVPEYDLRTQKIQRAEFPELIDGKWVYAYIISQLTQEELENETAKLANQARQKRNELLKNSDFSQLADAPTDKTIWATYRQQLRDITIQVDFPWNIDWPVIPL